MFVCEATADNFPCILRKTGEGFQIDNPTQKEIHMIAVDHCLLTNRDRAIQKCDCVIFDEQFFCFVELKLNVRKNISDNIKEAETQLGETIQFFERSLGTDEHFFGFIRQNKKTAHQI